MPDSDPGRLTDATISPPELRELDGSEADVELRLGEAESAQDGTSTAKADIQEPVRIAKNADELPEGVEGPENYKTWQKPDVTLVVTGQQHGYIEPCGCTGLERQKGGMARRFTLMKQLREMGWNLLPVDAGNQVRRFGQQPSIKLQQTVKALKQMEYQVVGFGP